MAKLISTLPDFVELSKDFAGQWIAIDPKKHIVVAKGESAKEVYSQALRKGVEEPLVTRMLASYGYMAPCLV